MKSIFSELPNDLIDKIVQIEDDRKIENDRKKYEKVIKHINKITTYDKFCPSIRETFDRVEWDWEWTVYEVWCYDGRGIFDISWWDDEL